MFLAHLVSLSDGQSYKDVQVCEEKDIARLEIPLIFEEWTACLFCDGQMIVCHHWKLKVIHLDRRKRSGKNSLRANRLILDGDISYENPVILHPDSWEAAGIPHFFIKRGGIAGQMAFVTDEGTFITHDTNCTSLIFPDSRKVGITSASQPMKPSKVEARGLDVTFGRIKPRKKTT
jgi:hypothetical protein